MYIDAILAKTGKCTCGNPASAHAKTFEEIAHKPIKCCLLESEVNMLVQHAQMTAMASMA